MREGSPGSNDPFRPPDIPIEVHCIHCGEEYESYLIKWVPDERDPSDGFWSCPTPGCDGIGFCFDIWPTDPDWRDENGQKVMFFDDEDDEGEYDEEDAFEDSELPWEEPQRGNHNGDEPPDQTFGEDDIPF
jgi:ferredoxin